MSSDVIITVRSVQDGDEENPIELVTRGEYKCCGAVHSITYDETELTGMEGSTTAVTIDGSMVTVQRTGSNASKLVLEPGARHESVYQTPYGGFDICVRTDSVDAYVGSGFGEISAVYHIEMDGSPGIENRFYMKFIFTE